MCGVSARRAIASPRATSRTAPRSAIQIPAWVAWIAGRGKGAATMAYPLGPRERKGNSLSDETIRTAALTSKAWPYEEARKLLKRWPEGKDGPVIFETGYGPSGLPHIGTLNEVLRTTMVGHAYGELPGGGATRLIVFSVAM